MAQNNYSQPYYGLPFHFPAQQMQQAMPAPDAHNGSQAVQHAPVSNSAFYIPGLQLQQAAASNANPHAYSHHAQQPPYPQSAWPPSDPAALFAMMHNAAMNGQPPPPLPGLPFPPQPHLPPVPVPQYSAPPPPFPPQSQRHALPTSGRIQEIMDSDREDGEVSESEVVLRAANTNVNGLTKIEPPRSLPAKPPPLQKEEGYNPDRPAAGQIKVKENVKRLPPPKPVPPPVDAIQRDREQAKQFIKLLHSNNIGYHALASENLDLEQLRGLYQSLNLPSEPAPILPPKEVASKSSSASEPVSTTSSQQSKPGPAVKTNILATPASNAAPSPVDRRDYIARLQAAKLAKQAGVAKPSSPQSIPPKASAPSTPVPKDLPPVSAPVPKQPVTDEQRARNTELIKQRLEAMRAGGRLPSNPVAAGSSSVSTLVQPPQSNMSLPERAAPQVPSGTSTPINETYHSGLPGIPGLFMQPAPSSNNSSKTALSIPQKRPAPTNSTENSTPRDSVTAFTRPLGDSPNDCQEEPMIIEVSDDESNGEDMDIDDDQAPSTAGIQRPGTIVNLPPQSAPTLPGLSAASTPGPQTPGTQARDKELKAKEVQLAEMREKLKRKLAEHRAKDKAAAAASSPAPQSVRSEKTDYVMSQQPQRHHAVESSPMATENAFGDAMHSTNELINDVKRRRREEIKSQLPSFDVELASNTSRMEQLMKEMEILKAKSEKIAEDKKRLTRELENLGVDTEGMSHDEMRAKKGAIEREMSPVLDTPAAHTEIAPAPVNHAPTSADPVSVADAKAQQDGVTNSNNSSKDEGTDLAKEVVLPGLGNISAQVANHVAVPPQASGVEGAMAATTASTINGASQSTREPFHSQHQGPIVMEDEMISLDAESHSDAQPHAMTTPHDVEDDFYSPAPPAEPVHEESLIVKETAQIMDAASPSEEGEVEMSVSSNDEEEYEPEEPIATEELAQPESNASEVDKAASLASKDISTEDEEAYEPPDIEEDMLDTQANDVVVENDTDAVAVEADDGAMDIASSSYEDSDSDSDSDSGSDSESDGEVTEYSTEGQTISASHSAPLAINVADDLAPELQSENVTQHVPVASGESGVVGFTHYESPLRMFKSYRYHPNFTQDVTGGFMSPTFSHQIDPKKTMCQYETAGGSCNDTECPDQHFRDLGITGETLLVQLGTANPGKTPEEKQQWNDGLRGVLNDLRKRRIKDPSGIAAEITRYRREFLNDDTRVVNL
ncbi:hypothetical protein ACEQ8H_006665 [Pleosporales sp. CAS-2024a]